MVPRKEAALFNTRNLFADLAVVPPSTWSVVVERQRRRRCGKRRDRAAERTIHREAEVLRRVHAGDCSKE